MPSYSTSCSGGSSLAAAPVRLSSPSASALGAQRGQRRRYALPHLHLRCTPTHLTLQVLIFCLMRIAEQQTLSPITN